MSNVIKVGIHTPNRTTTFYNYLINQGLDVQDVSWKNDTCDSFLMEDLENNDTKHNGGNWITISS